MSGPFGSAFMASISLLMLSAEPVPEGISRTAGPADSSICIPRAANFSRITGFWRAPSLSISASSPSVFIARSAAASLEGAVSPHDSTRASFAVFWASISFWFRAITIAL